MNNKFLKKAVEDITMPEDMKNRITNNIKKSKKDKGISFNRFKKQFIAAAVIVLCISSAIPVVAKNVDSIYEIMYLISPQIANNFQPVQKSDISNGIKMEVKSVYLHNNTAEIYITMQDLNGNRVDETIDLYDSYDIYTPFNSTAYCERVGYDEHTKTATFMISISQDNNKKIEGKKITFSVKRFLSQKSEYEKVEFPINLSEITVADKTQKVDITGGGGINYDEKVYDDEYEVLTPQIMENVSSIAGIDFTGIGFIKDKLHVQIGIKDIRNNDNHGFFYLIDNNGKQIECDANYYFDDNSKDESVDYIEYIFSITPQELKNCTLYGDFYTSGLVTEGDWKVTFPIENIEQ